MHKVSHLIGKDWIEHSFVPVFSNDGSRISGGVPEGDPRIFGSLAATLAEPFFLLYVLHTPRGEAEPGRYQSPELTALDIQSFIEKYEDLLKGDARFDIWVHSKKDNATIVWDRHNMLFAYGPLELFSSQLQALGFKEGKIRPLEAHQHYYRAELDSLAKAVLEEYPWSYSPLQSQDEQLVLEPS